MMRSGWMGTVALASILAGAGAARVQDATTPPPAAATGPADGFGLPGQIAISADLQLELVHISVGSRSGTSFVIQPAGDYFVAPHISVGGLIGFAHGSFDTTVGGVSVSQSSTAEIIGIRGGYDLRLAPQISLWPTLTLGYVHTNISMLNTSVSGYTLPLKIFAPVLFHLASHVFVGFGPIFSTELVASQEGQSQSKTTQFGLRLVVGGYFGGA